MADHIQDQPLVYNEYLPHVDGKPPTSYPQQQYPVKPYPLHQQQQYPIQYTQYIAPPGNISVVTTTNTVPPATNTLLAWLSCLFVCPIFSFVAIWKASSAENKIHVNELNAARNLGQSAKKWAIAAIIGGVVIWSVFGVIFKTFLYDDFYDYSGY